MTCIVGLIDQGTVWIGGDSAATSGWEIDSRKDGKVFCNGEFLFGSCGSVRMKQLIRFAFKPPVYSPRTDLLKFMVTDFITELRKCLREGGYAKKEHEVETGGNFLVGFRGRLFEVQSDYQVAEPRSGIAAIGCGAQIAYGAMFVTGHLEPRMRLLQALRASEFHNAAVRRPFVVKKMETTK